jgi:hypothetical protein
MCGSVAWIEFACETLILGEQNLQASSCYIFFISGVIQYSETLIFKNRNFSRGDFKKSNCVSGSSFGLDCSLKR